VATVAPLAGLEWDEDVPVAPVIAAGEPPAVELAELELPLVLEPPPQPLRARVNTSGRTPPVHTAVRIGRRVGAEAKTRLSADPA
jgi:hypothetical protein